MGARPMSKVQQIDVPQGSLLADYGPPEAYRDSYAREVPGMVSLPEFIERFYCSMAFRPERLALGLIGRGTSNEHAARLARGEVESFAAWHVVERRAANGGPQGRPAARSGADLSANREDIAPRMRCGKEKCGCLNCGLDRHPFRADVLAS